MRSIYLFDHVLPLVPLPLGQNIQSHFLDKLHHLQFGLHPRPPTHNPFDALRRREKLQRSRPHSLILLTLPQKQHETVKGRDAVCELREVGDLILIQLVYHAQFAKVVDQQGLEVYVQLYGIVLTTTEDCPVSLY